MVKMWFMDMNEVPPFKCVYVFLDYRKPLMMSTKISQVDKISFFDNLLSITIKIAEDFNLMPASPSSVNNKNNSSSKVNVTVTPQTNANPFPSAQPHCDDAFGFNPPDFMKQMISSVLTFKDDIPNLLRKIAYTIIAFIVISNCVMAGFMFRSFNVLQEEIKDNRAKLTVIYNKQREIGKALSISPVNPSRTE